jgi:hypothetical protein
VWVRTLKKMEEEHMGIKRGNTVGTKGGEAKDNGG